jgi:phage terminase large subunit
MNYPHSTALALRKTRESVRNSVVSFFQNEIFGNDPRINHKPSDYRFEYPNGSVIVYGGMKDKEQREAIKSIGQKGGVDIAWMEEATSFVNEDLDALAARMRGRAGPFRQIILTCNPDGPFHWIKRRLIDGREARVFSPRPEDNPANPPDYIDWLKSLTGIAYARMYLGEWVQADGMVYSAWTQRDNVVDPFSIPASWEKFISVDFGYKDPMVIQLNRKPNDSICIVKFITRCEQ